MSDPAATPPDQQTPASGRRSVPLRAYFAALVGLIVLACAAGAWYVRVQSDRDARGQALREASFAAHGAARLIASGVTALQGDLSPLVGNPVAVAQLLTHPRGCLLSFSPAGVFQTGHIDIVRGDGRVACSSSRTRPPRRFGYASASWMRGARMRSQLLVPVPDPVSGRPALIASAPIDGGFVAAVADLDPVGTQLLAQLSGLAGLRYLLTSADGRTVLAASESPARWVGQSILDTRSTATVTGHSGQASTVPPGCLRTQPSRARGGACTRESIGRSRCARRRRCSATTCF